MIQGDIWMVEERDAKARPYMIITRTRALTVLDGVVAVPLTRTRRQIPTELALGSADGLRAGCVASFDNVRVVRRTAFTRRVGQLAPGRWHEVCAALDAAFDC